MRSPKKSRICVLAMRMAMPFVNPMITGRGKYLTAEPMPVIPRMSSSTSSHHRAGEQAFDAVFGDDSETTTTNAPVGPPICVFEPPSAEIRKPVTIAQ